MAYEQNAPSCDPLMNRRTCPANVKASSNNKLNLNYRISIIWVVLQTNLWLMPVTSRCKIYLFHSIITHTYTQWYIHTCSSLLPWAMNMNTRAQGCFDFLLSLWTWLAKATWEQLFSQDCMCQVYPRLNEVHGRYRVTSYIFTAVENSLQKNMK